MSRPNLFMMPWFPRDFLASTRGWRLIPRAIYRELLDAQWEQGGLPADPAELRVLIGATPAEWRAGWPQVEPKFPRYTDGLRRNARMEEHRAKSMAIAKKRAKAGKLGGEARAAQGMANAKQMPESGPGKCLASIQYNSEEAYEGGGTPPESEYLRSEEVGIEKGVKQ
jgi:uncharacterized protein YdaU (DUF1376 family)